MITILGSSGTPCFVTGKRGAGVLNVRFKDKSFAGSLHIAEIAKQVERRNDEVANANGGESVSTPKREGSNGKGPHQK